MPGRPVRVQGGPIRTRSPGGRSARPVRSQTTWVRRRQPGGGRCQWSARTSFTVVVRRSGGPVTARPTPGGEKIPGTGPSGRLASAGGQSRAPGPGTRAGPIAPRGGAGAIQGGVPVRHHKPEGCRRGPGVSSPRARESRLYRIATNSWRGGCRIALAGWGIGLWFDRLWCLRPPVHRRAGTRQAPDPPGSALLSRPRALERSTTA
jgi:hypothetical protein